MFDPSLKRLYDQYPAIYLDVTCRLVGLPGDQPVAVVQPNVPPKTLDVDRAYRLTAPGPMVLHVEFESSRQPARPGRFLVYNVLLSRQEECPVKTVVLLMQPDADSPDMTGRHRVLLPTGEVVHEWNYTVLRLWQLSPELFMGHVGTMPLAILADVGPADVPALIDRIADEFVKLPEAEANDLASEAYILTGLRYKRAVVERLKERVAGMKESDTYQAILEEGEVKGEVKGQIKGLIRFASKSLGAPDPQTMAALQSVTDLDRVGRMYDRLENAATWADVLG